MGLFTATRKRRPRLRGNAPFHLDAVVVGRRAEPGRLARPRELARRAVAAAEAVDEKAHRPRIEATRRRFPEELVDGPARIGPLGPVRAWRVPPHEGARNPNPNQ